MKVKIGIARAYHRFLGTRAYHRSVKIGLSCQEVVGDHFEEFNSFSYQRTLV